MPELSLPTLASGVAIVDKKGNPTPQFILFWQRTATALKKQDAGQEELIAVIQQQQLVVSQLLVVVAQNVAYLNQLTDYLTRQANAAIARATLTQCAVGTIATATGTDISSCGDPGTFPPWPVPPPRPW